MESKKRNPFLSETELRRIGAEGTSGEIEATIARLKADKAEIEGQMARFQAGQYVPPIADAWPSRAQAAVYHKARQITILEGVLVLRTKAPEQKDELAELKKRVADLERQVSGGK